MTLYSFLIGRMILKLGVWQCGAPMGSPTGSVQCVIARSCFSCLSPFKQLICHDVHNHCNLVERSNHLDRFWEILQLFLLAHKMESFPSCICCSNVVFQVLVSDVDAHLLVLVDSILDRG